MIFRQSGTTGGVENRLNFKRHIVISSVLCKSRQFVGQKAIHLYSKTGFSLVELILAMGISTIILTAIYSIFSITSKNFTTQNVAVNAQQSLRAAIGLMARDIRAAGLDPIDSDNFGFEHAARKKISFTADSIDSGAGEFNGTVDDTNFERITYEFKDTQIEQTLYGDTASAAPLISNIEDVEFKYFDSANNDLGDPVPADQREDIRTVEIQITVVEPAGIDEPVRRTLTRRVECRNMAFN
jgi:prepilin-type N-terminal cleavage/methylation domain-containing protein